MTIRCETELEETYERLNMAEDLLACALSHLEGDPCYPSKLAIIDYLKSYFEFTKSGKSAIGTGEDAMNG